MNMLEIIKKAAKGKINLSNANSVLVSLDDFGQSFGLDQPHRLAHYLSQLMHESGSFRFDREIWGPTPAQKRYDTRKDLGNTPEIDGDGKLYSGKGPLQLTGKANYKAFTKWARSLDKNAPDFVKNPELINTDPWEGLSALWFWTAGNSTGKSLNVYADQNNSEMITRRINGGLNGYADRLEYYDRIGLVMLGYTPNAYREFQTDTLEYKGVVDGQPGPKTRAAIHTCLVKLTADRHRSSQVKAAPVTVERAVPVSLPELDKSAWKSPEAVGMTVAPIMTAAAALDWRVAIVAVVLVAGFAAFMLVRRDRMKATQAIQVAEIERANLT